MSSICVIFTLYENLRAGIWVSTSPPWTRARHRTEWDKWGTDSFAVSPILGPLPAPVPGVSVSHGTPGVATLCPQDPANGNPLNNSLTSTLETWWMFLLCPAGYLSWHLKGTVPCDTHITLLESDSSPWCPFYFEWLPVEVWVLVSHHWSFVSCHLLRAPMTMSTRVRLLPIREQWVSGCWAGGYSSHSPQWRELLLAVVRGRWWVCDLCLGWVITCDISAGNNDITLLLVHLKIGW